MLKLPLRYPGGKTQLVDYCHKFVRTNKLVGCTIFEPFAGGASISMNLLDRGLVSKAVINEKDHLLFHFWRSIFFHTDEFIEKIRETPISVESWHKLAKFRKLDYCSDKTSVEIGFACLFLNRTSFSGLLHSNPIGGKEQKSQYKIDCRFKPEREINSILYLSQFRDRVEVYNEDAIEFMDNHVRGYGHKGRKVFVYIDPPYYLQGKDLYRHYYKDADHTQLARYIKQKCYSWLISYDKHEFIERLYKSKKYQPISIYFDYSAHTSKLKQEELLISNRELPPVEINLNQISIEEIS
jgi:DNA adenine methylase